MRKLLPYEHQLIESLGVTKEEYLEFVAIQQQYKDPKVGTALDVRNTTAEVALVLTIVGTLFQVGAALLAPKPEVPSGDARRRNRQQRFAPSFGFNSTQDLAVYGDPINLIYTNENPNGDVRVAGSLVWSALDNFGSTQFMRLLVVLGAGEVQEIDYAKTAFGQTSLADLDKQGVFIFKDQNHNETAKAGPPPFKAIDNVNFGLKRFFPETLKPTNEDRPAFLIVTHNGKENGFSQAYTPSTSTSLGVFDAIPINVDVKTRDKDGDREESNISIFLDAGKKNNSKWRNAGSQGKQFNAGSDPDIIEVHFREENHKPAGQSKKQPRKAAADMRRQMADTLDFGSTYMLGSAKFRLLEYEDANRNITLTKSVKARFQCIADGQVPGTPYSEEDPTFDDKNLRKRYQTTSRILGAQNDDFSTGEIPAGSMVTGFAYMIKSIGTTDFTEAGADTNTVGEIFVAEKILTGTGTVQNASIVPVDLRERPYVDILFSGTRPVSWNTTYKATATLYFNVDNYHPEIENEIIVRSPSTVIDESGSIGYTQNLIDQNNAEKPTWKGKLLRRQIRAQKKRLKDLKEKVRSGIFDGGLKDDSTAPNTIFQCNNTYELGFNANNDGLNVNTMCLGWDQNSLDTHARAPQNRQQLFTLHAGLPGNRFQDMVGTYKNQTFYFFTFIYINAQGRWNFFNFSGSNFSGDDFSRPSFEYDADISARRKTLDNLEGALADLIDAEGGKKKKKAEIKSAQRKVRRMSRRLNRRIEALTKAKHEEAIRVIDVDIDVLDRLLDEVPQGDEIITDRNGTKAIRQALKGLLSEKEFAFGVVKEALDDWEGFANRFDNNFFSKCLVKAETASYSTLSECNVVNFSFKARLFRRISGRQKKYGEQKMREYSQSDNGVKSRMVFFRMTYREYLANGKLGEAVVVPHVFALRRGSESDFYTQVSFYASGNSKWEFEFAPIYDMLAEIRHRSFISFFFLENTDRRQSKQVGEQVIFWYGREVNHDSSRSYYPSEDERGPIYTNEWDMFSVNSDTQTQFSFESGPEIQLTAVTEQQLNTDTLKYENKYKDLSMMGVGVFAGRGLQDLRSITALVTKGKLCRTVENTGSATGSSSYAPDIFVDTLLDKENGIGKYIEAVNIDVDSLKTAKDFCKNNKLPGGVQLFMDGIIADAGSWREFWIANAPFSLLELARKNGKETLVPALPVNDSGAAAEDSGIPVEVQVSALFTTGNILEGSYKEEFLNYSAATEDLIASVIYREYTGQEIFAKNKSVEVSLKNVSSNAVRETFDLSQFVTQREQAVMFGKLLCNQRRHIRKGIEFQTFPSEAIVEPGAFIYVDVGLKEWDKYSSGVVMEGGVLNAPLMGKQDEGTQSFNFLLYDKDKNNEDRSEENRTVSLSNVSVATSSGISTASSLASNYVGYMFVMGQAKPSKRVYRVTEVGIEEEGEVSVKAIEYPCYEKHGKTRAYIADFRADSDSDATVNHPGFNVS